MTKELKTKLDALVLCALNEIGQTPKEYTYQIEHSGDPVLILSFITILLLALDSRQMEVVARAIMKFEGSED